MIKEFQPWKRYFARTCDLFLYNLMVAIFAALVIRSNILTNNIGLKILYFAAAEALMLFIEPLFLSRFGTTPGKAILGISIQSIEGRNLTYNEALDRTWDVLKKGMALNVPPINFIFLIISYQKCREERKQPWESDSVCSIKEMNTRRIVSFIGTYLCGMAVLFLLYFMQTLPPNRGDITIEEFTENYNYYSKLLEKKYGNVSLDKNGEWLKDTEDGGLYFENIYGIFPEYDFILENGNVKGISFEVIMDKKQELMVSYDKHMLLILLALAGSEKKNGLFANLPVRIMQKLQDNAFQNFSFTEAHINAVNNVDYVGYVDAGYEYLVCYDEAHEHRFYQKFSVRLEVD